MVVVSYFKLWRILWTITYNRVLSKGHSKWLWSENCSWTKINVISFFHEVFQSTPVDTVPRRNECYHIFLKTATCPTDEADNRSHWSPSLLPDLLGEAFLEDGFHGYFNVFFFYNNACCTSCSEYFKYKLRLWNKVGWCFLHFHPCLCNDHKTQCPY